MPRFPARTVVLMVLTLIAFGWFYRQTHLPHRVEEPAHLEVEVLGGDR
jgi:hypothetical protein